MRDLFILYLHHMSNRRGSNGLAVMLRYYTGSDDCTPGECKDESIQHRKTLNLTEKPWTFFRLKNKCQLMGAHFAKTLLKCLLSVFENSKFYTELTKIPNNIAVIWAPNIRNSGIPGQLSSLRMRDKEEEEVYAQVTLKNSTDGRQAVDW